MAEAIVNAELDPPRTQFGDSFGFLASQLGTGGMFASLDLPALAPGLSWAINPGNVTNFLIVVATNPIDGDYNGDGVVDAADYVKWRDTDGTQPNYDKWRANFGRTAATGSRTCCCHGSHPSAWRHCWRRSC